MPNILKDVLHQGNLQYRFIVLIPGNAFAILIINGVSYQKTELVNKYNVLDSINVGKSRQKRW